MCLVQLYINFIRKLPSFPLILVLFLIFNYPHIHSSATFKLFLKIIHDFLQSNHSTQPKPKTGMEVRPSPAEQRRACRKPRRGRRRATGAATPFRRWCCRGRRGGGGAPTPPIRGRRHVSRGQWRWFCGRHRAARMDRGAKPPAITREDRTSKILWRAYFLLYFFPL